MSTLLNEPFDSDNEEGSKFTLLPVGTYKAEIYVATIGPTKTGRGQVVNITWRIVEGEGEGRNLFQTVLIDHDSPEAKRIGRAMFKDICVACEVTGQVTDLEALYSKPCAIKVGIQVDKAGNYEDRNRVQRVLPAGAMATPAQVRQAQAGALREATATKPAFKAEEVPFSDEIPF
jgi:Protein of unknown function (DUF669)